MRYAKESSPETLSGPALHRCFSPAKVRFNHAKFHSGGIHARRHLPRPVFQKADRQITDLWDDILFWIARSAVVTAGGDVCYQQVLLSRRRNATIAISTIFSPSLPLTKPKSITPTCGNMLAGVGPYAIETGMIQAQDGETAYPSGEHWRAGGGCGSHPGGGEFEGEFAIDAGNGGTHSAHFMNVIGFDGTGFDWREDGNHRRRSCHHHRRGHAMHDYAGRRCRKNWL